MPHIDLREKFPDMRPTRTPPSLDRVAGCGSVLLGSRSHDPETNTSIKTLFMTVLFLPIVALKAYRVAPREHGGWYFLGRVPLSGLARGWNVAVLFLALGGIGLGWYEAYRSSPEYKAAQRLAEADHLIEAGKVAEAAAIYRDLLPGPTEPAAAAREQLVRLLDAPPSGDDGPTVFRIAAGLQKDRPLVKDVYERGRQYAELHAETDPKNALEALEAVLPHAAQPDAALPLRRRLVEALFTRQPGDIDMACRLAEVCKAQNDLARCKAVLTPFADKLGQREGAAILGHALATEGKTEQAIAILGPYVDSRLPKLRAAEQAMEKAITEARTRLVEQLKNGTALGFDFAKASKATNEQQDKMVVDWLNDKLKDDPTVTKAYAAMHDESPTVEAALDLGMVLLQRAQAQANPEARKADLERAEHALVDIRAAVGNTDMHRLFLGQVYYWMGRQKEGRELFDQVLAEHKRATEQLRGVARLLREVGVVSEARALVEEAWNKEGDAKKKRDAAFDRSLMSIDLDDELLWLGRCDPEQPGVKANLCMARGRKAQEAGKDDEAATQYRKAVAVYDSLPENYGVLNNRALVFQALYDVTRDADWLSKALSSLERASALRPEDSIVISNVSSLALDIATREVVGPAVDWKALKGGSGTEALAFLYRDKASRQALIERLARNPSFRRSKAYFDKLALLSPKSAGGYGGLSLVYQLTRDAEGLKSVAKRLEEADVDLAESTREALETFAGKKDAKDRERLTQTLAHKEGALAPSRRVGGVTFALAASRVIGTRTGLADLNQHVDADALVKLAEEAHASAPSAGTAGTLQSALRFRAHQALIKDDRDYATQAARTRRSLGANLLTWVLGHEGALRNKALALPDVQRIVELTVEEGKAFPDEQGVTAWAILRGAQPDAAARIAKATLADPLAVAGRKIGTALGSVSASVALQNHWVLLMAGKNAEAWDVIRKAQARGVPLPTK